MINTLDQLPHLSVMVNNYKNGLRDISTVTYESLQIVMEFMDKGIKGLVSGDLSVFIV
jgi:hypothetical protein